MIPSANARFLQLALIAALLALVSCAPSRYVRPLEKDELAVSGSFGGPLFKNFGAPIPVPFATVSAGYGLGEKLTGFAGFNLTSLSFANLQFDLGVSRLLLEAKGARPGISITPSANLILGMREGAFHFYPSVEANAFWEYGERKSYFYAGLNTWLALNGARAHGDEQPQHLLPTLQVGHVLTGAKWDLQVDMKWGNFSAQSGDATIEWSGLAGNGAVGIFLGVTKRFGK